jgi:hypothetical protein
MTPLLKRRATIVTPLPLADRQVDVSLRNTLVNSIARLLIEATALGQQAAR